jgi:polygalacturonase
VESVNALASLRPALPVIPERRFLLTDFGAVGDGRTLNTEAFRKALEAVKAAGGGHLVVPKGVFRTLGFSLCSNLDLHLEEGAVIQAPDTFAEYGLPDPSTLHSQKEVKEKIPVPKPFITGDRLHDVSLTGTGTIDGAGALWWAWSERAERAQKGRLVYRRAHLVVISGCERLLVADLTLRNSPMFHLVPRDITDLTIERVRVRAPFNAPNTDAIDPGPVTRAWIHHCDIDTGDDDIVIKSGCDRVLIEDCRITHGHGISVGSGTNLGVRNMLVRNCTLTGTDNGLRIKSMVGAGGPVQNIVYRNIRMRDVENAILLDLNYVDNNRPDFRGDPRKVPSIRDVLFEDIVIEGSPKAGRIVGLPQSRITGLTFRKVHIGAEQDLVIRDADEPVMIDVTKAIVKGAAKPRERIIE